MNSRRSKPGRKTRTSASDPLWCFTGELNHFGPHFGGRRKKNLLCTHGNTISPEQIRCSPNLNCLQPTRNLIHRSPARHTALSAPVGWPLLFSGFVGQLPIHSPLNAPTRHRQLGGRHPNGTSFMQERWLSVEEIAAHLGVNRDTIYKWLTRKKMPAHKVGRLWKFLASEVDAWVKGGKAAQVKPSE